MSTEIIGKCYLCKKEITRHDISHTEDGQDDPVARYHKQWPGDGVVCTEHPGVRAEYDSMLDGANSS
jgi:hypothetical protein